jgi:hypothetical protein
VKREEEMNVQRDKIPKRESISNVLLCLLFVLSLRGEINIFKKQIKNTAITIAFLNKQIND